MKIFDFGKKGHQNWCKNVLDYRDFEFWVYTDITDRHLYRYENFVVI